LNCTVCVRAETFESLATRWEAIAAGRPGVTVFDTLTWQQTWWEAFGEGARLSLLSVSEDAGPSLFIAPMMTSDGCVSFLGGTDLVDYHDFLSADAPPRAHVEAMLKQITNDPACRTIDLLSIPGDSPSVQTVPEIARAAGWQVEVTQEDVAPRMLLPATFDEYVESLSKKDRHELRRKMRRTESAGTVRDVELTAPGDISAAFGDFLALHRKSTPEKAEYMTPDRERFFRRVAGQLALKGIARLRFLEFEGKRVATSLSWVIGGTRYLYNSGYDPEFRELSVGLINHVYAIRASIAEGIKVFDFMRGSEPYKYHLGGQDRAIYRITCSRVTASPPDRPIT
jgi:CelD/BcsL family acetyltransferase involved in cellulose biosynthesis